MNPWWIVALVVGIVILFVVGLIFGGPQFAVELVAAVLEALLL